MSHITIGQQGLAAVKSRNWDEALPKLDTAIAVSKNPAWLIGRSKALAGLKRYAESLEDAEMAWQAACHRNNRELIAEAQYRRAVAYHALGQHANADACCVYSMRIIKGNPSVEKIDPAKEYLDENGRWTATAEMANAQAQSDVFNSSTSEDGMPALSRKPQAGEWRMASMVRIQTLRELEKLPDDDPARKWTTSQKPLLKTESMGPRGLTATSGPATSVPAPSAPATATAAVPTPTAKPAVPKDTPLEIQDYQNPSIFGVSIFSKDNDKSTLEVEFFPRRVVLKNIVFPSGDLGDYELNTWGEIDPEASSFVLSPKKVELRLVKKVNSRWAQLRAADDAGRAPPYSSASNRGPFTGKARDTESSIQETARDEPKTDSPGKGKENEVPADPQQTRETSRVGPKNWDRIVGDESDDDGNDINVFFKGLYKRSTPEQQRAMIKSFTESNGTTLSTDWDDIKKRTVGTAPPEGVEAKKWE